jgi:hypothetical protein
MTDAGSSSAASNWRSLFVAAILELHSERLLKRIEEAESAITERLKTDSNDGEREAMLNALLALGDLRRMASNEKNR